MPASDNMVSTGMYLPREVVEVLDAAARRTGLSRAGVVGALVSRYGPTLNLTSDPEGRKKTSKKSGKTT